MYAYDKKNQRRAKTLALSIGFGTIAIIVAIASVLTSGIYEKQMRMLTPMRASEIFEININNDLKSLTYAVQNLEKRIESLSNLSHNIIEIEKPKDLFGELSSKDKKTEEMIFQKPSTRSAISKASRTRSSRALHRKLHRKA